MRDCATPSSGSLGSGKSRWADLEVEDEAALAQPSDLGVWASASSDCSDHAREKGSKKNNQDVSSCSDSDSSGYPSQTDSASKRGDPHLPNKTQNISGYQHFTFSDSSQSGSRDADAAKHSTSGSGESTRVKSPAYREVRSGDGYSDVGGRNQLVDLRTRLMQRSIGQHYGRIKNIRSMRAEHDGTAEHQPLQGTGATASTAPQANHPAPPVQFDGSEQLPSVGSVLHDAGGCKPCLLIVAKSGCSLGADCDFCHFKHVRKSMRPSKGKRERFKRLLERAGQSEANGTGFENSEVQRSHLDKGLLSL